jgi:hypothetical protein
MNSFMIYEYIRISSDLGSLEELCALASTGWRFCAISGDYMLLEREIPVNSIKKVQDYYANKH